MLVVPMEIPKESIRQEAKGYLQWTLYEWYWAHSGTSSVLSKYAQILCEDDQNNKKHMENVQESIVPRQNTPAGPLWVAKHLW